MPDQTDHAGMAALAICEALLLALNDNGLLPEHEIVGILRDAAATHESAAEIGADANTHLAVAKLINQIIASENSVRKP